MNWYSLFYWISVADGVKAIFDVFSNIFTTFAVVSLIIYVILGIMRNEYEEKEDGKKSVELYFRHFRTFFWISMIMSCLTWFMWVAVPTKKDCLLIVAGGGAINFLTTDSSAKQLPHEAMNYVVTELKTMAKEAKVDLGIQSQKDKVLETAKNMTTSELLETLKTDSVFAKIILNQ